MVTTENIEAIPEKLRKATEEYIEQVRAISYIGHVETCVYKSKTGSLFFEDAKGKHYFTNHNGEWLDGMVVS